MKHPDLWRPTKFVSRGRALMASRDRRHVAPESRLVADLLASKYHACLQAHARGELLDLGAGTVPLYESYRGLVDSVTCVDWAHAKSGTHIDILADLNEPLPLADASYDTVLVTDVLEHVFHPHQLFAEIARVLRLGGKLLLGVPFLYWVHEAPHDYGRYTEHMLRKFCEHNALRVAELEATGGSPEILFDLMGKHLGWSSSLAGLHASLARRVLQLPGMAALSRHSARWFPLGYLLVAERSGRVGSAGGSSS